jgi:hypothetical protein
MMIGSIITVNTATAAIIRTIAEAVELAAGHQGWAVAYVGVARRRACHRSDVASAPVRLAARF